MADEDNRAPIAPALRSLFGHTSQGEPLSNNRAPADDLAPWIARVYATDVEADPRETFSCGIFSDTPIFRVIIRGKWTAETIYGTGRYANTAVYCGPQTRRMPISVQGSFAVVGIALKPGAVEAIGGPPVAETLDRMVSFDEIYGARPWGKSETLIKWLDPEGSPERWLKIAEELFRQLIRWSRAKKPDPIVAAFDKAAFADPNLSISEFSREHDISVRQVERVIKSAFGLTPKLVLRRARALDMAAHLRGVADDEEAEVIALRFYDQSHMIREFVHYFGMTPKQFARSPQPLMTLTLEARQSRRLEVLGRNHPGTLPPWRR